MEKIKMKDWQVRSIKTFIQSFGGIAVPEICIILTGNLPATIEGWKMVLVPVVCAALAAGISAVWNVIQEKLKEGTEV